MEELRAHSSITQGFPIDGPTGAMVKPVPTQPFDTVPETLTALRPSQARGEILQHGEHGWSAARLTATGGLIVVLIGAAFILGWML